MEIIRDIIRTIFSNEIHKETINKQTKMEATNQKQNVDLGINPNWVTSAKKKITKSNQVKNHLIVNGQIDSWTAIEKYGATRLSAIIFNLRKAGYNIISIPCSALDRNSNISNYTTYKLENENN
jgi:hypothetical protein